MKDCVANISICMNKLPKGEIRKGSDGKMYLGIIVRARQTADEYGNTLSVFLDLPKDVRETLKEPVYVGEGTFKNFKNENAPILPNQLLKLRLCIDAIPQEGYRMAENGKAYANMAVQERKEKDRDGNTLYVIMRQSKEEREAEKEKIYVGAGRLLDFAGREKLEDMEGMAADAVMPWEVAPPYTGEGYAEKPVEGIDFAKAKNKKSEPGSDEVPF